MKNQRKKKVDLVSKPIGIELHPPWIHLVSTFYYHYKYILIQKVLSLSDKKVLTALTFMDDITFQSFVASLWPVEIVSMLISELSRIWKSPS